MWEELGIPATRDAAAIRRAYAARVRAVHPDRDAAGFMRLRAAYEEALQWAQTLDETQDDAQGEWFPERDVFPPDELFPPPVLPEPAPPRRKAPRIEAPDPSEWGAIILPPPEMITPAAETAAFVKGFEDARAAGRLPALLDRYRVGLARGLIPLGQERARLEQVLEAALADPEAAPEDLRALSATACGVRDVPVRLLDALTARLDAESWYAEVLELSRRHIPLFGRRSARIAHMLLAAWAPREFRPRDIEPIRAELAALRLHAPLLGERVDPGRADLLHQRIERQLHPTPKDDLRTWLIVMAILGAMWLLAALLPG